MESLGTIIDCRLNVIIIANITTFYVFIILIYTTPFHFSRSRGDRGALLVALSGVIHGAFHRILSLPRSCPRTFELSLPWSSERAKSTQTDASEKNEKEQRN